MITYLRVDGFRSLRKFSLELRPGLNVLVGPNGAGKTNIIAFFEFLSNLVSEGPGSAFHSTGGVSESLTRHDTRQVKEKIDAALWGSSKLDENNYIEYMYSFEITVDFERESVILAKQTFNLREEPDFRTVRPDNFGDPSFVATQDIREGKPDLNIEKYPESRANKWFNSLPIDDVKKYFGYLSGPSNSLIANLARLMYPAHLVEHDIRNGETFNIIPSRVKKIEESTDPPGIKRDGSGLAPTLWAMQRERTAGLFGYHPPSWDRHYDEGLLTRDNLMRIKKNLQLANPAITDIEVVPDTFTNQLSLRLALMSEGAKVSFPLTSMSDGTVKWLTLITAILTSPSLFSIEEPENYLHPWMQAEIIRIMRNNIVDQRGNDVFILMTTHSTALLDEASVEEVIVVAMEDGGTKARRVDDPEQLAEEIAKTGFGLGHLYKAGLLD